MSTITYKSFKLENLKLTTPEENKQNPDMTKNMLLSLPRYLKDGKEVLPQIQSPWLKLSNYGIPGKMDRNGKLLLNAAGNPLNDRELGRLKVPFNLDDDDSKKFYELMTALDQKVEDDREQIWGDKKKANIYKYVPLVRTPAENPDAPEDAPVKPDYFTAKFDFDYKDGKMKTAVYVNTDGDRTAVETPTLDDVKKYVRYKSECRLVFSLCKLYASKAADTDGKRKFGFGLKLKHIEVKPSEISAQDEQDNAFVDEDDEDEVVERRSLVKAPVKAVPVKAAVQEAEEEEEGEEEDDEEKPAPKKAASKAAPKAAAKAAPVQEAAEEDEEDKPAPKPRRARGSGARTAV